MIAAGTDEGIVYLCDAKTGERLAVSGFTGGSFNPFEFSPDGEVLIVGIYDGNDAKLVSLDLKSKQETDIPGVKGRCTALNFSPDGKQLAVAQTDNISVMDWTTRKKPVIVARQKLTWNAVFSPDGKLLITSDASKTAQAWDWKGKKSKWKVNSKDHVSSVAVSPDGKLVAIASNDVRICDASTGKESTKWAGYGKQVHSVTFSANGRWLASAGTDGAIRIWDVKSRKDALVIQSHPENVSSLAFNPKGDLLAACGQEGPDRYSLKILNIAQINNDESNR
jgi:Tol biopolymer transport system component